MSEGGVPVFVEETSGPFHSNPFLEKFDGVGMVSSVFVSPKPLPSSKSEVIIAQEFSFIFDESPLDVEFWGA